MNYEQTITIPKSEYKELGKALKYHLAEDTKPYSEVFRQKCSFINGFTLTVSTNYDKEKKKRSRIIVALKNDKGKGVARNDIMHMDTPSGPYDITYSGITYELNIVPEKEE